MENIRVLIVEDKLLIAEAIASTLKKHSLDIAGMCDTGEEAIELVKQTSPDLILMDIELAGALDGISTTKMIQNDHQIPVIYLSDFTDQKTVDRAKKTLPANYIAKPFQEADLVRAIDIAFNNANTSATSPVNPLLKKHVFLRTDNQVYIKLAYSEILYLEAERAYCTLATADKKYVLSNSMNHVHEQLDHEDFIKIHRSYVVNAGQITAIDGNVIEMGKEKIQMSDGFREDLIGRLKFLK
jgi:DNA-binding LytR/AlgR family response regulator